MDTGSLEAEDWRIRDQVIHAKLGRLARSIRFVPVGCGR